MKNSMLLLLGAVLVVAQAATVTEPKLEQWSNFKIQYNRQYESKEEELHRMNVFFDTLRRIQEHNAEYEQGLSTYTLGVNKFADWTHEEFLRTMSGGHGIQSNKLNAEPDQIFEEFESHVNEEEYLNWDDPTNNPRHVDAVGEMQDQEREKCASGWAFAATATIEGAIVLQLNITDPIYNLSEQQLIDCAVVQGCIYDPKRRNTVNDAFNYLYKDQAAHGIEEETYYGYTAEKGVCVEDPKHFLKGVKVYSITEVQPVDLALKQAVKNVGPIAVMIDNTDPNFMNYQSGIYEYKNWDEKNGKLEHGVTVIGYGGEKGQTYWILKNSYGEGWGEGGYMKMLRNKKNHCGITSEARAVVLH